MGHLKYGLRCGAGRVINLVYGLRAALSLSARPVKTFSPPDQGPGACRMQTMRSGEPSRAAMSYSWTVCFLRV